MAYYVSASQPSCLRHVNQVPVKYAVSTTRGMASTYIIRIKDRGFVVFGIAIWNGASSIASDFSVVPSCFSCRLEIVPGQA